VRRNGSIEGSGGFTHWINVSIILDSNYTGDWNYTIFVIDPSGNNQSYTAIVNIYDITDPSIEDPGTFLSVEQLTFFILKWNITEVNNGTYEVRRNGSIEGSGGFTHWINVSIILDSNYTGDWNYTILVIDPSGNTHTVIINIYDNTDPSIEGPGAFLYIKQLTSYFLEWNITEVNNGTYEVRRNGSIEGSGIFYNWINVTIQVNSNKTGDWNYTILVIDPYGNNQSYTIIINIFDITNPSIEGIGSYKIIEKNSVYTTYWNITEINNGTYEIRRNGSIVGSGGFTHWVNISIQINTTVGGYWNYTVFASDPSLNLGNYTTIFFVNNTPPFFYFLTPIPAIVNTLPLNISFVARDTNLTRVEFKLYDNQKNLIINYTYYNSINITSDQPNYVLIGELWSDHTYNITLFGIDIYNMTSTMSTLFNTKIEVRILSEGNNYIRWFDSGGYLKLELDFDISDQYGELEIFWLDNLPLPKDNALEYFQLFLEEGTINSTIKITYHFKDEEVQSAKLAKTQLVLFKYDRSTMGWVEYTHTLKVNSNTIVFELNSFSYFVIAQRWEPTFDPIFIILGIIIGIVIFGLVLFLKRPKVKKSYKTSGKKSSKITWTPVKVKQSKKERRDKIKKLTEEVHIEKFPIKIREYRNSTLRNEAFTELENINEYLSNLELAQLSKKIDEDFYIDQKQVYINKIKSTKEAIESFTIGLEVEKKEDLALTRERLGFVWVYNVQNEEKIFNLATGLTSLSINETKELMDILKDEEFIYGEVKRIGIRIDDNKYYLLITENNVFKIITIFIRNPGKILDITLSQLSESIENQAEQLLNP
jgi:hypothetical protein